MYAQGWTVPGGIKEVHQDYGSNLEKYPGQGKVTFENANEEDEIGIVRGLAWTSVGGIPFR